MFEPRLATLPNGSKIHEINAHETRFLYNEIFRDRTYLSHGVQLADDAVVFDIGANIGLFSLFCLETAPNARVYAFEPAPECLECLRRNVGDQVQVIAAAAVDRAGPQNFTYYPNYSIMSGLMADHAGDSETLRKGAINQFGSDADDPRAREMVDMLVASKLVDPVAFTCEGLTISDVMEAHGVDRIDLLKVDVEKAERYVLDGIAEKHWPAIRQVVLEAHDLGGAEHLAIEAMLKDRGFSTVMDTSDPLSRSDIYNIYAIRR